MLVRAVSQHLGCFSPGARILHLGIRPRLVKMECARVRVIVLKHVIESWGGRKMQEGGGFSVSREFDTSRG